MGQGYGHDGGKLSLAGVTKLSLAAVIVVGIEKMPHCRCHSRVLAVSNGAVPVHPIGHPIRLSQKSGFTYNLPVAVSRYVGVGL